VANDRKRISKVSVHGLQGIFNYELEFGKKEDTVIIIAPNGYGKTALLSLLKSCVSLNLRKVSSDTFEQMDITFEDKTRWVFKKVFDERKLSKDPGRHGEVRESVRRSAFRHRRADPYSVIFQRFDKKGREVEEVSSAIDSANETVIVRALDRLPFLSAISMSSVRDLRSGEIIATQDALRLYYNDLVADPYVRELIAAAAPEAIWGGIAPIECLFIETQRLLYSKEQPEDGSKEAPQEEILRQARALSTLLQDNYADYATKSQALDRSFPSRLIGRARKIIRPNIENLRTSLRDVEEKRSLLTDAGILVDQADSIISMNDEIAPEVAEALQIYVEDSRVKLGTYDEIYPKVSVFRELMSRKLKPKRLSIGRDFGAAVYRDETKLSLSGLSSGEKHEFIMLFKLIFETKKDSLVLIDEPEISLHVVWQLEFMSDLRRIQNANPFQSMIATHSPQIFQGFKHLVIDLADQAS
jgi:ABC-type lipoprotein export system ATPase subunit